MENKADSLLVHLARAGDADACEKLVKKYYSSIYQYCLLHIFDSYEAEDLTQEVFIRFFSNLYRYKEYGKIKNYLGSITNFVGFRIPLVATTAHIE
ncbi:RNA polymerase sigma factor [Jutongia sp.]